MLEVELLQVQKSEWLKMVLWPEETAGFWQQCQMQSIPRPACKVEASVGVLIDMLLFCTAFSNEGDELKKAPDPDGRTSNWAAPTCSDTIHAELQGLSDECTVIYES